mmetsp:Transcript_3178/g.6596  ORF Transcript_3178/g.6596 Transcript_3178/m.6596 type:complete len:396 (-) Transcript_3178:1045-2232(-)
MPSAAAGGTICDARLCERCAGAAAEAAEAAPSRVRACVCRGPAHGERRVVARARAARHDRRDALATPRAVLLVRELRPLHARDDLGGARAAELRRRLALRRRHRAQFVNRARGTRAALAEITEFGEHHARAHRFGSLCCDFNVDARHGQRSRRGAALFQTARLHSSRGVVSRSLHGCGDAGCCAQRARASRGGDGVARHRAGRACGHCVASRAYRALARPLAAREFRMGAAQLLAPSQRHAHGRARVSQQLGSRSDERCGDEFCDRLHSLFFSHHLVRHRHRHRCCARWHGCVRAFKLAVARRRDAAAFDRVSVGVGVDAARARAVCAERQRHRLGRLEHLSPRRGTATRSRCGPARVGWILLVRHTKAAAVGPLPRLRLRRRCRRRRRYRRTRA